MPNFQKFNAIFAEPRENEEEYSYKERKEITVPIIIDLDELVYWYPEITDDLEISEDCTNVVFKSGFCRCLHISFNDFTIVTLGDSSDELR